MTHSDWNAAIEMAAKSCETEADKCIGDIVEGDEIGRREANARAGALLTAARDIRALKRPAEETIETIKDPDFRPRPSAVREACAWRVRYCADGWIIYDNEPQARFDADQRGARIEPLYATPPATSAGIDREALRHALRTNLTEEQILNAILALLPSQQADAGKL